MIINTSPYKKGIGFKQEPRILFSNQNLIIKMYNERIERKILLLMLFKTFEANIL